MSFPESLPARASDAGPEDQPRDWYERLCEAEELLKIARRYNSDSVETERRYRRDLMARAIEHIKQAMEEQR